MSDYDSGFDSGAGGNPATGSRLKAEASAMLSSAKEKLGNVAEPITDKAREVAEEQKTWGAEQINAASRAVDGAARELEEQMPQIAGYIHDGAKSLERVAGQIKDRNLEDLASTFSDFARRQPVTAFAGCVVAGFAISRFIKAGSRRTTNGGYRTQTARTSGGNYGGA